MASVAANAPSAGFLSRSQDLVLPMAIIASVLVIMVPLPAALMDVLLSANIAVAVIILLTTIYVRTPLEFSVFPTLLLATTLARLVLNVATTRLILSNAGSEGDYAAGHVVVAFADFVAGGGRARSGGSARFQLWHDAARISGARWEGDAAGEWRAGVVVGVANNVSGKNSDLAAKLSWSE